MAEKIVVLSTSNNPDYYWYAPYQRKAWNSFGWKVLILTTPDVTIQLDCDIQIALPEIECRKETLAQAGRLYAANHLPEDAMIMTCDIDLVPASDYWQPEYNVRTVYGHDLTDFTYIPMGYVAMTGRQWKEVMKLTGDTKADMQRDLKEYADMVCAPDWETWWNVDWRVLTDKLKPFDVKHVTRGRRLTGTYAYGRVDRGDHMYLPPNETIIDIHSHNFNTQHPDKVKQFTDIYERFHGKV